jgi:ketosteroid isomerase-like protein
LQGAVIERRIAEYSGRDARLNSTDALRRWADTWQSAWEALALEPIVALYAEDALFSSQPFRMPYRGRAGVRAYVAQAFAEEEDVRAWFSEPVVQGDRAAVEWWASMRENGRDVTFAGTSILRFDGDGLVIEQRDTWNEAAGRLEPPPGWGR